MKKKKKNRKTLFSVSDGMEQFSKISGVNVRGTKLAREKRYDTSNECRKIVCIVWK